MIYTLVAIGAFMSVITAAILNSISRFNKYKTLKRVITVLVSLILFIIITIFLLQQKTYE